MTYGHHSLGVCDSLPKIACRECAKDFYSNHTQFPLEKSRIFLSKAHSPFKHCPFLLQTVPKAIKSFFPPKKRKKFFFSLEAKISWNIFIWNCQKRVYLQQIPSIRKSVTLVCLKCTDLKRKNTQKKKIRKIYWSGLKKNIRKDYLGFILLLPEWKCCEETLQTCKWVLSGLGPHVLL